MTHFPYLKKLELLFMNGVKLTEFDSFLDLNPQLSSCVHINYYDWKFDDIIAKKTNFKKFELISHSQSYNQNVHFRHLKHFAYCGDKNSFPFTFDKLEKLKLCSSNIQIDNIIKQNPKLMEITLQCKVCI